MFHIVMVCIFAVIGFFCGGIYGNIHTQEWSPMCWHGCWIGIVIYIGVLTGCCCMGDIDF